MGILWYLKRLVPDSFWRDNPPWHQETFAGPYEGQPNYWSEYGYKDPVMAQGRWRLFTPIIREDDPLWWDPPVKDGESRFGIAGRDAQKTPGMFDKWDNPIPQTEYSKYMYENHPNIKEIYDKYDISKEHPGLRYAYNLLNQNEYRYPEEVGQINQLYIPHTTTKRQKLSSFARGPAFFSKPMGEGCFEKVCASVKWFSLVFVPIAAWDYVNWAKPRGLKNICFRYVQLSWLPLTMMAMWASSTCLTCSARKKDDYVNMLVGGVAAGTVYGHVKGGFMHGSFAAFWWTAAGLLWHNLRLSDSGFSGFNLAQNFSEYPLLWKKLNMHKPSPSSYPEQEF